LQRFQGILKDDPEYTFRDGVYYYLGETYLKAYQNALGPVKEQLKNDALAHYEKLVAEFTTSEYLERAKKRIAEIKR
jgi:outer membrane protein assembly factor BamD (BamD/ComL family)